MTHQQLEQHVPILGWLHIVSNAFFLLIGGFVFLLLTAIGAFAGEPDAVAVLTIVGIFIAGLFLLLGLPGIVAGWGLLKRKPWSRILALVVGILGLVNFPIGTAIGVYTLWVLLHPESTEYFAGEKSPA
jgi:hypothetical protein